MFNLLLEFWAGLITLSESVREKVKTNCFLFIIIISKDNNQQELRGYNLKVFKN
jgi:hypothetical protein